jgi:hypothetical protein
MALTTEQLRRQATQQSPAEQVFVDPMQQAIDNGYRPGSGVMYNDKFYESLNPGRISMDASPIDMLMQTDPEFARRYQAGEFETVMNPNRNPQMGPGTMMPAGPNGMTGDPAKRLPGGGLLPSMNPFDDGFFPAERTVGDPSMNISQQGIETQVIDTTDIFDIGKSEITNFLPDDFGPRTPDFNIKDPTTPLPGGNTPFNNPIAPMPSPLTPPPTMNSSHSHDDLLQGIGDLFKQYFPSHEQNKQENLLSQYSGQPNLTTNFGSAQPFNGPGILGLITPQRA